MGKKKGTKKAKGNPGVDLHVEVADIDQVVSALREIEKDIQLKTKTPEEQTLELLEYFDPDGKDLSDEEFGTLPESVQRWYNEMVDAEKEKAAKAEADLKEIEEKDKEVKEKGELKAVEVEERLPVMVEDLRDFILVGKEKLKAQQAKIRAIEKVNLAYAAKAAALSDTQDLADILLDAEVRLGEILKADAGTGRRAKSSKDEGKRLEDYGLTKAESHSAQLVAEAKENGILDRVKEEAREKGQIPTSKDVVSEVRKAKPKKAVKKTEKKLVRSEEYREAFGTFMEVVKVEKKSGYEETSKQAILVDLKIVQGLLSS